MKRNYARNRFTGETVFFDYGHFDPERQSDWVLWHPVPRLVACHVMGEDDDVYALRQLCLSPAYREAQRMLARWEYRRMVGTVRSDGFTSVERERIEVLKHLHGLTPTRPVGRPPKLDTGGNQSPISGQVFSVPRAPVRIVSIKKPSQSSLNRLQKHGKKPVKRKFFASKSMRNRA